MVSTILRKPIHVEEVTQLPGKDLSRWETLGDDIWVRRLGEYSAQGVNATDGAIATAAKLGVNIFDVIGSGKDGRITKADVEAYASE